MPATTYPNASAMTGSASSITNSSTFLVNDQLLSAMMQSSKAIPSSAVAVTTSSPDDSDEELTTVDLESLLGLRRQDLQTLIPITLIYCVIFVTGVVGNVGTAIVIKRNKYMHTATNYYLCNLVLSDMLVLVLGLPLEAYSFWSAYPWIFGETFCVVRSMAAETSTYASILTITAFTVERYLAICHPMRAKLMSGLRRAVRTIIVVWVVSAGCSVPIWIQYGVAEQEDSNGRTIPDSALCMIRPDRHIEHVFEVSSIVFFIIPMSIISVLYGLIGLSIRRSALYRNSSSDFGGGGGCSGGGRYVEQSPMQPQQTNDRKDARRAIQQARARLSVLKMLVAVVVAFFICWAPFHIQRLVTAYSSSTPTSATTSNGTDPLNDQQSTAIGLGETIFFYVSGILYYVSSVINPILYNIMSLKFREAFKDTIFDCCCCHRGAGFTAVSGGNTGGQRLRRNRLQASIKKRYSTDDETRRDTMSADVQRDVVYRGGTGSIRLPGRRAGNDFVGSGGAMSDEDCEVADTSINSSNVRRYRFYGRQSSMLAAASEVCIRNRAADNGSTRSATATSHRRSRLLVGTAVPTDIEYVGMQAIGELTPLSGTAAGASCSGANFETAEFDIDMNTRQRSITCSVRPTASVAAITYNAGRSVVNRSVLHVAPPRGPTNVNCRIADPGERRWNINWFRPSRTSRCLEDSFA